MVAGRRTSPLPVAGMVRDPHHDLSPASDDALDDGAPEDGTSTLDGSGTETVDGRRLRRDRNRAAVVDALLELFREGNLDPSSDEIAARSGVSARSIFRYFDDVTDLAHEAILRQQELVLHLIPIAATRHEAAAAKVAALVRQRADLFDTTAMVGRAARAREPFHPLIAGWISESRRFLRGQVAALFEPELSALDTAESAAVLAAVDLLTGFENWQLLRLDQQRSRDDAERLLVDAITRLIGG